LAVDVVPRRTERCGRHVAGALYDSGDQPLSGFSGLVLGGLYADLLGLGDLFRNARTFHGPVPLGHSSISGDRDCRDQGNLERRAAGARTWLIRPTMVCWPNSKRPKRLLMRSSALAAMAIACLMPLPHFRSMALMRFSS